MKDLYQLMQFPADGIYSTVIEKNQSYDCTLMCLSKGTHIDTHTSTKTGSVYVVKGTGTFQLYEEEIELKDGVYIHLPKDAPHSLVAQEDLAILLHLIKV